MPHTPTPWKFSPWHIEEGPPAVLAPAGHIVCTTASDDDAEFIAKAVNNHNDLVNALRNARNYIDAVVVNTPDKKERRNYAECLRIIEAALKPVGGNEFTADLIRAGAS